MDKTLSISLGGFSFVIDELAYHKLSQYLQDIKTSLRGTEGITDIIEDVEIRIAELLKERTRFKEVVNTDDINHVITVMGHPDQYKVDEDYESNASQTYASNDHYTGEQSTKKRLLRDPDDKVISGLSAGIAHYLGLDPWVVRAIWLTLLIIGIFTGFSAIMVLVAYFIMVIIIPLAESTSDKLSMFGKPANFEHIKKNALEASETVANTGKKLTNSLGSVFSVLLRAFLIFVGIFVILIGLSFIIGAFSVYFMSWFNIPAQFFSYFIEEQWMSQLMMVLASLLMLIPGVLITILGIKMLSPRFSVNKTFLTTSVIVWFLALIGLAIGGVSTARNYTDSVEMKKEVVLNVPNDTIEISFEGNNRGNYRYKFFDNDERPFYVLDNELYVPINKSIQIKESADDRLRLEFQYKARGKNGSEAKKNIDQIEFKHNLQGNKLVLDDFIKAGKDAKFRDQDVEIILYVPKTKVLKTNSTVDYVSMRDKQNNYESYFDISNNYFGHNGEKFVCLNCSSESEYSFDNDEVAIGQDGDSVNINQNGVQIKSKTGEKVIINQDQIYISDDTDTININYRNHNGNR